MAKAQLPPDVANQSGRAFTQPASAQEVKALGRRHLPANVQSMANRVEIMPVNGEVSQSTLDELLDQSYETYKILMGRHQDLFRMGESAKRKGAPSKFFLQLHALAGKSLTTATEVLDPMIKLAGYRRVGGVHVSKLHAYHGFTLQVTSPEDSENFMDRKRVDKTLGPEVIKAEQEQKRQDDAAAKRARKPVKEEPEAEEGGGEEE